MLLKSENKIDCMHIRHVILHNYITHGIRNAAGMRIYEAGYYILSMCGCTCVSMTSNPVGNALVTIHARSHNLGLSLCHALPRLSLRKHR